MRGRSFCDSCKKQIEWYDNIPLLSFLILDGKCRSCGKKISPRYPIIEFVALIGFLAIPIFKGLSLEGVYSIFLFLILEIIFIIDLENQIIPDFFIFLGILVVLLMPNAYAGGASSAYSLVSSLFSGFIAATFLLLIHLITKGRGMGLGDVKFAILGGMIVGLPLFPVWLFVAFLTGAAVGIILILTKHAGLKDQIAFGPFLVISIPITLLWGQKIIEIMLLR